jgi:hypothetical protein
MTTDPDDIPADAEELAFCRVTGGTQREKITAGPDEAVAPEFLAARLVRLADGTELRQLRVAGTARRPGYECLDNEILAGLRLRQVTGTAGYPAEVSCLYGYEATSADPCALLEQYRGEPLTLAGQYLLDNEQHQFQVSLLTGLCWIAAAGIAHRGIAPSTVRWDGRQAQITDFSLSTVIGAPREAVGTPPWAAREQRPGQAAGRVSARDDIWAAGRLIFYVSTREELTNRSQIDERPGLRNLLAGVFGPSEERPTARELLSRLNEECPVVRALDSHSRLDAGRKRFYAVRAGKHPGVAAAPDAGDDAGDDAGAGAGERPGEPGAAAWKPPGQDGGQTGAVFPSASGTVGQPRSARRLRRRFPPLTFLIAGGLAIVQAAIVISLVR